MELQECFMNTFVVIGKEGSTRDGAGFIEKLWEAANGHFDEVSHLAKKDNRGRVIGVWGLMSDFSREFHPWAEDFTQGLYLAGVECGSDATAPPGWSKWTVPSFDYLFVQSTGPETFAEMIRELETRTIPLAGAVQELHCPETGNLYLFAPIRRL